MTERTPWNRAIGVLALSLSLLAPAAGLAQPNEQEQWPVAQALYDQATAEMDAKNYASACPKLEEVERLLPEKLGAKLTTAQCYEGQGRLASAWAKYTRVEALAGKAGQAQRAKEAAAKAAELRPRLATLTIGVPPEVRALPGLAITRDGVALGEAQWGLPVPVDKGQHRVVATATDKQPWEKGVEIQADGVTATVTVEPLPAAATTLSDGRTTPSTPGDRVSTTPEGLSHRFQPGALARIDLDPLHPGVSTVVGLTMGVVDHVELGVSALIGRGLCFRGPPDPTRRSMHGREPVHPRHRRRLPRFLRRRCLLRQGMRRAVRCVHESARRLRRRHLHDSTRGIRR
jgi:hypothetical protein